MTTVTPLQSDPQGPALQPLTHFGDEGWGWPPKTTYDKYAAGQIPIPVIRIGKKLFVRRVDAEAFLYGDSHAGPTHAAESACDTTAS